MAHRICYLLSGVLLPFVYGGFVLGDVSAMALVGGASVLLFLFGHDLETSKKTSQG